MTLLSSCERPFYPFRRDHLRKNYQRVSLPGLPSWVPEWTSPRLTSALCGGYEFDGPGHGLSAATPYETTQSSIAEFKSSSNDKILTINGACYDTIQQVSGLLVGRPADAYKPALFDYLDSITSHTLKASQWYEKRGMRAEALWRSLLTDRTQDRAKASIEYAQDFLDWRTGKPGAKRPSQEFFEHVFKTWTGRQLITTAKGLIGFGPLYTMPGDLVCVLRGCSVPLILRRGRRLNALKKEAP